MQTDQREEIMRVVREISSAWEEGRPQDLTNFFHEDMVIAPPDFGERVVGRQPCIDGYADFCRQARIRDLKQSDYQIDVLGSTAVATYHFEMDYDWEGKLVHDAGRDVLVFTREKGEWQAVWRTIIPDQH